MYQLEFHQKVDKEIARLDKTTIKAIRDLHIPAILQNPYKAGKDLSGNLAGTKSYRFMSNRVDYRIIYDIIEERKAVIILMVGPRENIYKKLLNRLK